ncbi:unnamed protein product [Eretmochelys imbricata]
MPRPEPALISTCLRLAISFLKVTGGSRRSRHRVIVTSFRSGPHCARHCTHTYQRDRRCPRIDAPRPAQALPPVIGWVEEPQGGRTAFDTQFPFCITSAAWGISTPQQQGLDCGLKAKWSRG